VTVSGSRWAVAAVGAFALHAAVFVGVRMTDEPADDVSRPEPVVTQVTLKPIVDRAPPVKKLQPKVQPQPVPQPAPLVALAKPVVAPPVQVAETVKPRTKVRPVKKVRRKRARRTAAVVKPDEKAAQCDTPDVKPTAPQTVPEKTAPLKAAQPPVQKTPVIARKSVSLRGYGARVAGLVMRWRRYPRRAMLRGQQGTVRVRIRVNRSGALVGLPNVVRSCGHDELDAEAIRMVRRAAPFPVLPAGYVESEGRLTIPVVFRLRN
jgi:protein TonB